MSFRRISNIIAGLGISKFLNKVVPKPSPAEQLGEVLTPFQVYSICRYQGLPVEASIALTAIAGRESNYKPGVRNTSKITRDDSYGLYQINRLVWKDNEEHGLIELGIQDWDDLLDPVKSTRAAKRLFAGHLNNLSMLWYIYRGVYDSYQERFDDRLPEVLAAALEFESSLRA